MLAGDVAGAVTVFGELGGLNEAVNDVVGRHAASYGGLLATTVVGEWDGARAAAAHTRRTASAALLDDGAAAVGEMGMLAMIDFLSGVDEPGLSTEAVVDIEWPTPEMAAATTAYFGAVHARGGRVVDAQLLLDRTRQLLPDLGRDGYWLATISMVADTCHRTGDRTAAGLVCDLLAPALELTITDPGLIYRGAAAHFAGLAASVLGRTAEATELLRAGLATHERHGSTWMAERSRAALAATA